MVSTSLRRKCWAPYSEIMRVVRLASNPPHSAPALPSRPPFSTLASESPLTSDQDDIEPLEALIEDVETALFAKEENVDKVLFANDENNFRSVALVSTGGGGVEQASKVALSVRSPYFRGRLYEEEGGGGIPTLGPYKFTTPVLQAIVDFCHTNQVNFEWLQKDNLSANGNGNVTFASDSNVVEMVRVLDAALHFELSKLYVDISDSVIDSLDQFRSNHIIVLMQELMLGELGAWHALLLECFKKIKEDCPDAYCFLDAFGNIKNKMPSWNQVMLLKPLYGLYSSATDEEKSKLKKLADEVKLESIDVAELEKLDPCPLFSADRLRGASAIASNVEALPTAN